MMIEISKNPNLPFLDHPRGPHFFLQDTKLLHENASGEEVYELPLADIVEYLKPDPENMLKIEAMGLLSGNNGMGITWHQNKENRDVASAFAPNGPLIHTDALGNKFIDMNLERIALVLARNPFKEVKEYLITFLTQVGIKPNMERINADYCTTCGQ
jgi:hypothetical protein